MVVVPHSLQSLPFGIGEFLRRTKNTPAGVRQTRDWHMNYWLKFQCKGPFLDGSISGVSGSGYPKGRYQHLQRQRR
eukprot:759897-Hanusia_phi.AAC.4